MAKLFFLKIFLLMTIILTFSYVNVKKKSLHLKEKIMEKIQKSKEDRNQKKNSDKSKNSDENKDSNENTETNRIFNNYKEGYQNFKKKNSQGTSPEGEETSSSKRNVESLKWKRA